MAFRSYMFRRAERTEISVLPNTVRRVYFSPFKAFVSRYRGLLAGQLRRVVVGPQERVAARPAKSGDEKVIFLYSVLFVKEDVNTAAS